MRIGALNIAPGAGLAPMAGATDMPFRRIAAQMGASWTVTEMLSAKGFLLSPPGNRANEELLCRDEAEGVTGLQIFGHEPRRMAEAARALSDRGFAFLDINMGCPARKIVSGGDGSALLDDPLLAGRVVGAVVAATPLPVTVKIRAGRDDQHIVAPDIAKICEAEGACALTVHPRTRMQQYGGKADWGLIARVVQAVKIPVVGNGDITSGADAVRMLAETGCAAVAAGRAAQGNPWLFAEIRAALTGTVYAPPTYEERVRVALAHLAAEIALRGERSAVLMMRGQLSAYIGGTRGCARKRVLIHRAETFDEVRAILQENEDDA